MKDQRSRFQTLEFIVTGKGSLMYNRKQYRTGDKFKPVNLSLSDIIKLYRAGEIMPIEMAEKIAAARAESAKVLAELEKEVQAEEKRIDQEMEQRFQEAAANE